MRHRFTFGREEKIGPRVTIGLRPRLGSGLARLRLTPSRQARAAGFTLVEIVIALGIITLVFAGILQGNVQSAKRAEWSGYSLAAQALTVQQLEQARSALWDNAVYPPVNQLTNLNLIGWTYNSATGIGRGYTWADLDIPISGTNKIRATNFVTLRMINMNSTTNPPIKLQMVEVQTVWPFKRFGGLRYFTNRTATYMAPDDRSPGTF
jgi:type II secretory pathway pseudopilin PulG